GSPVNPDSIQTFATLNTLRIPVLSYTENKERILKCLATADMVIDAMYGIGFKGELTALQREITCAINASPALVAALDIPSGVNADTAYADSDAVCADYTIVFECLKPAHLFTKELSCLGSLQLIEIGIPPAAYEGITSNYIECDNTILFHYLKPKPINSYKGSAGRLLNVAGSIGMAGAAVMSTQAALSSGTGYVTLAIPQELYPHITPHLVSPVCLLLKPGSELYSLLCAMKKSDAVSIGCGLGSEPWLTSTVNYLIENCKVPMVIDADGINALSSDITILKRAGSSIILTPHLGEFAKLTGLSTQQISRNKLTLAVEFSREHNVVLVLKGANTVVTSPDGLVYVNNTGNPGLAKAGSGDILTGIIASLTAQGIPPYAAAVCGVYLHGISADRCSLRLSQYSMQPLDILSDMCDIFRENNR
ncbi:MAG: NAD(P)H-hydrate dehydratase, partial [Oscillospiraceae bacterium]